ncbi:hypothetical protein C9374_013947 [Naegleria lovaniensis]|uniref:Uncharacterized protein n=1 Tax=Naegleria lovaniensis TaxID=51637 RepID=A0AA88GYF8_NAELO|nr:uncharacterized protein C9374_013947 [Naegleria lovaniensis]KAG2389387.1 hypothetical protein C9374_013947 [Naegleria lovaniensis]
MFRTVLLLTASMPQFHWSCTLAATLQPTRAEDFVESIGVCTQVKKKKPVVTTETGWQPRLGPVIYWVPESIQAKYTLRSLMLQWMRRVERTYLYEMCDDRECFGLLYYNSTTNSELLTPKPVYYFLKNMISELEEKPRQRKFTLKELTIEMNPNSTTNSKIQHTLFQKSNGNYYLAIWQETFGCDKGVFFNTTSLTVNLNFTQLSMFNVSLMRLYTFDTASGSMTNSTVLLSKKQSNLISANFQITDTMTRFSKCKTCSISKWRKSSRKIIIKDTTQRQK